MSSSTPAMSPQPQSATPSTPNSTPTTASAAGPVPTTREQLCAAQLWPRPVPDIVGMRFSPASKVGALQCWDNIRGVAPDGHDPVNNPAHYDTEAIYRIAAVSPPAGTPIGRHELVTVQLAEIDSTAPPVFRPCDWMTASEAASILGGPVTIEPGGDSAGSVDMWCSYRRSDGSRRVGLELLVPGAFPVDAASQFALATAENATAVDGLGVKAACRSYPTSGQPFTTLFVLLNTDRLFKATGSNGETCDTLKQFAQVAIGRIGA